MDIYYEGVEELREDLGCERTRCREEEWKRWDDELVEDFSRWLNRAARALVIALCVVSAAILIRLL